MILDTPISDGWNAPDFKLKDLDGNIVTMQESMGKDGLLIAFICNHCPYVKAIADRLAQDADQLISEGINVLAIMPNDYQSYQADSPENMRKFAKTHRFNFPYLIDEDQTVAKEYNAICTPDFFGFNNKGELQYRGRLDDAKMTNSENCTPELINAMRLIAKTGKGPKEQIPSIGCSIKWRN